MSVTVPARSREQRARDVVSANYELRKEEFIRAVGSRLRAAGLTGAVREDLEEAYNQGWHGVCRHIEQGRTVTSLGGLLYTIMLRRAIDICRQKRETPLAELDLDQSGVEPELTEQLEHQEKLRGLLDRLRENLNSKERQAVTLCVIHGYSRPEAAELLGIDRMIFERIMDGATKKISRVVATIQARGCSDGEWSRLMRDYALGLLPEQNRDYLRAREHTEGPDACAACSRYVHALRGLSAVLPPFVPIGPPSGLVHGFIGFLRGLFGASHTTTPATTSAMGTAAAGVPLSAGQAAGSGGIGLVAGGSMKAVLVLTGIVAASTASLQPSVNRHRPRHYAVRHSSVSGHAIPQSYLSTTARSGTAARAYLERGQEVERAGASPGSDVRHRNQVAAEFGIEGVRIARTPPRASASAQGQEAATSSGGRGGKSAPVASAAEFGIRSAGTTSRASQATSSEFGFEGSHG
jgi:RNA polymerase sigma factor (sigma-70 family)